jgi:hypothetical protein
VCAVVRMRPPAGVRPGSHGKTGAARGGAGELDLALRMRELSGLASISGSSAD